jgi:small conductance mechanosensitive channel
METGLPFIDQNVMPWLYKILVALLIFGIGKWIVDHLSKVLLRVMQRARLEETLCKFLYNLGYWLLLTAVLLAAVEALGVSVASLLAVLGAAGLAVGLAIKDSLSNLAAGVMIIVFRPFRAGDSITAAGQSGTVDEIGMFSTLLNTADNQRVIIPNSAVIGGTIINATSLPTRRIDLIVPIRFEDSIGRAREVIAGVLVGEARILADPPPLIGVDRLGEATVDLFVRPWVRTVDYGATRAELQERLKSALEEAGIMIAHRPVGFALHSPPLPAQSKVTSAPP